MNENIRFDYNNMMSDFIGTEHGITPQELTLAIKKNKAIHQKLMDSKGIGMMGWTRLPYEQKPILTDIINTAKKIRKYDSFVVLGIGGSALGANALFNALCHMHHNGLKKSQRKSPKFYVEDNIDPVRFKELLDVVDVKKTIFNVITKSGSTSETMSQFMIIYNLLKSVLGDEAKDHIIATTDEKEGNLIKIAKEEGFKTFYIPAGVGGRFSVISPVGLLPAAVLRIDIKQLLKGCIFMDKKCRKANEQNPAYVMAILQKMFIEKKKNISVMMPYSDNLKLLADWYAQLWGESLGKKYDNDNNIVYTGQTPVRALGVTDQHSQIQLYAEGPFDKVITFLAVETYKEEFEIPHIFEKIPSVSFLSGHTLNELITNERIATEYALSKNNRPNNTIYLPEINAYTIGQLLMFFMLQTSYLGEILNINTFNQPGVEEGKNATYALFNRKGYEDKRLEIQSAKLKMEHYLIR